VDPIREVMHQTPSDLERQAGFAHACCASEGDETDLFATQQGTDGSHLLLTPNQGSEVRGQGVGRRVSGSGERGAEVERSGKRIIAPLGSPSRSKHISMGIRVEIAPANHLRSDSVEPLQAHLLDLAQVGFAKLALLLVVEVPVPLLTSAFPPHGEAAHLVAERKGQMLLSRQPTVPGLGANQDGLR
jgi:hypothetical protein